MKKLYAVFATLFLGCVCFSSMAQQDYSLSAFAEPSQNYTCFGSPVYNHVVLADSGGTGCVTELSDLGIQALVGVRTQIPEVLTGQSNDFG